MVRLKRAGSTVLLAGRAVPVISLSLFREMKKTRQEKEKLQSELEQAQQKIAELLILIAQQQKDMANMHKKYARQEQEIVILRDRIKVLLAQNERLQAQLLQLRRSEFGQSSEKMENAGNDASNTTALPEGTAGNADEDTDETKMAEGRCGEENPPEEKERPSRKPRTNGNEKIPRPDNVRRQMARELPTVCFYPLSPELIRKLDELYGRDAWRILTWDSTPHLVHIPEIYVNQIDFTPVLCLKDGTPVRPFSDHPELFPTSILPHSIVSPSEFANLIHNKFALGLPLYRQEKDLQQMVGIHLGRQEMARWIIRAGTEGFVQVYDYLIRQERACKYHSIDETYLQVLMDGRSAATKSFLWAHRTGELANPEHPIVVFIYEPTRATEHLRKYFPEDIAAVISCDHYIAYEILEDERENVVIALCWMHARRRFFFAFDLLANIDGLTDEMVKNSLEARLLMKIGEIYREEMKLKDLSPEKRKTGRSEKVRPLVEEFFSMLHEIDPDDPSFSHLLRDAVKYALGAEEKLKRFLDDPSIPIDNGSAERIIRSVAAGRRAWLFCDTPDGAKALALFYSLVTTARLNDANDYYYIKYLCEHMPLGLNDPGRQLSDEELEKLMPWSEDYRAYEKHEIESRYSEITLRSMQQPTKKDIQMMREQCDEQNGISDATEKGDPEIDVAQSADPADNQSTESEQTATFSENALNNLQISPSVLPQKAINDLVKLPDQEEMAPSVERKERNPGLGKPPGGYSSGVWSQEKVAETG